MRRQALFHTYNRCSPGSEYMHLVAISPHQFAHNEDHGAGATMPFADIGDMYNAGYLLADAQGARIVVDLFAVQHLHFCRVKLQPWYSHAERGGKSGGSIFYWFSALQGGILGSLHETLYCFAADKKCLRF